MAGKKQHRRVNYSPKVAYFRPDGIGIKLEWQVILWKDEVEALRLVDFKKESQISAARSMEVSQPTLSRALQSARAKIAEAIISGKAIKLESSKVILPSIPNFETKKEKGRFFSRR